MLGPLVLLALFFGSACGTMEKQKCLKVPRWVVGRQRHYEFQREFRRDLKLIGRIDARRERSDVLIYGDSIIAWNKPMDLSRIKGSRKVWDKNFGDLNAEPLGIPSDRLTTVFWRLAVGNERPRYANPKVVILFIGTNDAAHNTTDMGGRLEVLLQWLETEMPDTHVIVQGLLAHPNSSMRNVKSINALYKKVAVKRGIKFSSCLSGVKRDDRRIFFDQVHLTPYGMDLFLKCLRKVAQPMIDKPRIAKPSNARRFCPAPGSSPPRVTSPAPARPSLEPTPEPTLEPTPIPEPTSVPEPTPEPTP